MCLARSAMSVLPSSLISFSSYDALLWIEVPNIMWIGVIEESKSSSFW